MKSNTTFIAIASILFLVFGDSSAHAQDKAVWEICLKCSSSDDGTSAAKARATEIVKKAAAQPMPPILKQQLQQMKQQQAKQPRFDPFDKPGFRGQAAATCEQAIRSMTYSTSGTFEEYKREILPNGKCHVQGWVTAGEGGATRQ